VVRIIRDVTDVFLVVGDGGAFWVNWDSRVTDEGGDDDIPFAALGRLRGSKLGESRMLPLDWFLSWDRAF
jgi:hypothetical protein